MLFIAFLVPRENGQCTNRKSNFRQDDNSNR